MAITLLDVIRGNATKDDLAPDAPYCHEKDLLTPKEAAQIRQCKVKTVYSWLKPVDGRKACLFGLLDEPIRVFGWSLIRLMQGTNPPAVEQVTEQKASLPRKRHPSRGPASPLTGYQFLREKQGDDV
jgi:hypothetical protein